MNGRHRTTREAAEIHALRATGMASGQISEQLGIPQRTVAAIIVGEGRWGEIIDNDPEFARWKGKVSRKLQITAWELATKSFVHAEKKLPDASYHQAILGGAILIDKARLLGDQSTENLSFRVTKEDIADQDEVMAKVAAVLALRAKETEAK